MRGTHKSGVVGAMILKGCGSNGEKKVVGGEVEVKRKKEEVEGVMEGIGKG